jgi:hypothetical protein
VHANPGALRRTGDLHVRNATHWNANMFTILGLAVLIMSLKFILGTARNRDLLVKLNVESSLATQAGILGVGFVIAVLVSVIPVPALRLLLTPAPIVILFCVPGLIVLRTFGLKLDRTGIDSARPARKWVDQGKLAGWLTCAMCLVNWAFSTLPFLLSAVTTG